MHTKPLFTKLTGMASDAYLRKHDPAARRKAQRAARQKGCSIYITASDLLNAGIDPEGEVPQYRCFPGRKGSVLIQFYVPGKAK